jgi:LysR family transcriptional activator of nhaA
VPRIVGEFEDTALVKVFAEAGAGLFAAPAAVAAALRRQYRVHAAGTLEGVHERFYALTLDRRITHPAVAAITRAARRDRPPPPG